MRHLDAMDIYGCYGYLWVSSTWMPVPLDPLDPEAAKAAKIKVANVHAGDRRKQGFAKGTNGHRSNQNEDITGKNGIY